MAKLEDRQYDLRTLDRNLRKGTITKEQYDAYLSGLQDAQEHGVVFDASFVEGVLEDEETAGDDGEEG
ncbi:MAG: hypothetical protein AAGI01_16615 [Myxococcota bacterium]